MPFVPFAGHRWDITRLIVGYNEGKMSEKRLTMETIKLTTRIDNTGKLRLDLPTHLANQQVEVLVVLQRIENEPRDALGWPIGYFDEIDAIKADDVVERGDQGTFEIREPLGNRISPVIEN